MRFAVKFAQLLSLIVASTRTGKEAERLARSIEISYEVKGPESSSICQKVGADFATCYTSQITVKNIGSKSIGVPSQPFALIIPSPRRILKVIGDEFTLEHITGDLNRLTCTNSFVPLDPGEEKVIEIISEYWAVQDSDTFPRWMVEYNGYYAVIPNTDTENVSDFSKPLKIDQARRTPCDNNTFMNSSTRFDEYPGCEPNEFSHVIIPHPLSVELLSSCSPVRVEYGLSITNLDLPEESFMVILQLSKKLGIYSVHDNALKVKIGINPSLITRLSSRRDAGYHMQISGTNVDINGYDKAGAMYGFSSLISLFDIVNRKPIPAMIINDSPRFEYRGFMLDIARNFQSVEEIKKIIDQMFLLKLNKLHLHLSDDEGWRIEIKGLEELTDIGGYRLANNKNETIALSPQLGHGTKKQLSDGYLTRKDFIDCLKYAEARNIDIIPEIDMPAHSRAAVVSMEARYFKYLNNDDESEASKYRLLDPEDASNVTTVQFYDRLSFINVCLPTSLAFVEKVIMEIGKMYDEAKVSKYSWHFGGDEAKNIKLGRGFSDKETATSSQGIIDKWKEDLPFQRSPVCQKFVQAGEVDSIEKLPEYFAKKVAGIAKKYGFRKFQGWQDGLEQIERAEHISLPAVVNLWDTLFWGGVNTATKWSVEKNYEVILSIPEYLYFDSPYEVDPAESGYYWASRGTNLKKIFSFASVNLAQNAETSLDRDGNPMSLISPEAKPNIAGISGHVWGELLRTSDRMDYMIFPRLYALAERAWSKAEWELDFVGGRIFSYSSNFVCKEKLKKEFEEFLSSIGYRQLSKLDKFEIKYRMPMVGIKVEHGTLKAKGEIPGIRILYRLDGGNWRDYNHFKSIKVLSGQKVEVRTFNSNLENPRFGRISSIVVQ